jgi:hypothetical protein
MNKESYPYKLLNRLIKAKIQYGWYDTKTNTPIINP